MVANGLANQTRIPGQTGDKVVRLALNIAAQSAFAFDFGDTPQVPPSAIPVQILDVFRIGNHGVASRLDSAVALLMSLEALLLDTRILRAGRFGPPPI